MDSATPDQLTAALDKLKKTVPSDLLSPRIAIICGSGLSALGSAIDDRIDIPYNDIPGFLTSHGALNRYDLHLFHEMFY
jgi:purine-nucleoside phosphorylase